MCWRRGGGEQCLQQWGETARYLESKIPQHTFTILPLGFNEIRDAVESGKIDFILANPSYYVNLEVTLGAKRIATLNNLHANGVASNLFAGVLVTRRDREDIRTWKDIRGKKFMAVDRRSLGGWHMVLRELRAEGIDPQKDFQSLEFGGTHDAVIHAIESGLVDVGTVRSDTLERMAQEGKIDLASFKVLPFRFATMETFPFLSSTRQYPEWPFAKAAHTDEQLAKMVAIALLQMEEESAAARTSSCKGWTVPQNYQPVHELLKDLHLPPYDNLPALAVGTLWKFYKVWFWGGVILTVLVAGTLLFISRLSIKLKESRREERARHSQEVFLNTLIESIPIPIYYKDNEGTYKGSNQAYEEFLGVKREKFIGKDAFGLHPKELAAIYKKKDDELIASGGHQRYETKICTGTGMHEVILDKAVFSDETGRAAGMIGAILDITELRRYENLLAARLRLSEFSINNPIRELLRKVLDETEMLVDSKISFFHFVKPDQKTLSLQMWSTNTLEKMCKAEGENLHYPIDQAGVWCDCVRDRKPIIHNDYASLPHRKGYPEGHARVVRQLVVPVFRQDKIVAVLGVGNKEENYTQDDVQAVAKMADLAWDLVLRKKAEDAKRESDKRYRTILDSMEDSVYICSRDYTVEYANPAMMKRIGRDITGERCYRALYGRENICPECHHPQVMAGKFVSNEVTDLRTERIYHVSNTPIGQDDGKFSKLTVFRDISNIRSMEDHLQQAQKMEAIGTLAGGIAHDFNNILCPMLGYAEILKNDLRENPSCQNHLQQILLAGARAKELIAQILSFSRQNTEDVQPIYLQAIVKESLKLLRSSIPAHIEIESRIDANCGPVMARATQCHQVIMNLTTNAFHAMDSQGGNLLVTLKQVQLSAETGGTDLLPPGEYACLSVTDTGTGIDPSILPKIFNPYFTTKEQGKGTGLGLSVVQGIVRSLGGDLQVESTPGQGTDVRVFIPVIDVGMEKTSPDYAPLIPGGKERILVVDDEKSITQMLNSMLSRLGYRVTQKNSSIEALDLLLREHDNFDLVVTDMLMPKLSGIQLVEEARRNHINLPVILCTGFCDHCDTNRMEDAGIHIVVKKPFTKAEISEAVRDCLDQASAESGSFITGADY